MNTILIEGNEHTRAFMDDFMAAGLLPHTQRFFDESQVFETRATDESLEPWVQWATIHTGVPQAEHGLRNLGDAPLYQGKRIWDHVVADGGSVVVFGSMNAGYQAPIRGWFVPDPWNPDVARQPAAIEPYFAFVQAAIAGQMGGKPFGAADALRFVQCVARHGLSLGSIKTMATQLLAERSSRRDVRWRRVCVHDRVQWDLFRHAYRRVRPQLATFFSDAVAHLQHHYWRHARPELFALAPSTKELASYGSAIEYSYREFDRLLGSLMELAGNDVRLAYASALSQQPYTRGDEQGGKHIYKPDSFEGLLRRCGVDSGFRVEPVMAEQANLHFDTSKATEQAQRRLGEVRYQGQALFHQQRLASDRLMLSCAITTLVPPEATFEFSAGEGTGAETARFYDVFSKLGVAKSGYHHPAGFLWIREPARTHFVHREVLELTAIAPMLLDGM